MSNKASSTEKVNLPSKSSLLVYSEDILGFRKAFSIADNDYDQCLTGLRKIDLVVKYITLINSVSCCSFSAPSRVPRRPAGEVKDEVQFGFIVSNSQIGTIYSSYNTCVTEPDYG